MADKMADKTYASFEDYWADQHVTIEDTDIDIARAAYQAALRAGNHPSWAAIEQLGARMGRQAGSDAYCFRDTSHLVDFVRELLTGEPHVNGWPLMSGLPNRDK